MRVAVIDIGSNTARLLVADAGPAVVDTVAEERAFLGLGAEIARRGKLRTRTVERVARVAASYAETALERGAERLETIVTAPGRQGGSAAALVTALATATAAPVRVLMADEEGRLAYDGAVVRAAGSLPEVVGVVDVGGGSTELVVGTPSLGPAWVRSVDLGSLRLAHRCLTSDPPSGRQLIAAETMVGRALDAVQPPCPDLALATGGSARAVARVVGRAFGADDLGEVLRVFASRPSTDAAGLFGIDPERAGTVLAGALLLRAASQRLGCRLQLARGGLREGAALALAAADTLAA